MGNQARGLVGVGTWELGTEGRGLGGVGTGELGIKGSWEPEPGELGIKGSLELGVEGAKERVPESVTRVASEGVFSFTLLIKFQPWTSSGYDMQRHNKTAGYKKSVNSILPVRSLGRRKPYQ